jgi:glycosyltransferase involved in cell wall biosynthesis
MTAKPTVSVIIPTYNRAELISKTIENVFQQTYKDFEIIVVDDGSTDNTIEKLSTWGDRIRVIRQANAGPSAARNHGVQQARGEIIAFQDSDDTWMPTKLERQIDLLQRAGNDVPCCLCAAEMHFGTIRVISSFELAWLRPELESGLWTNVAEVLATTSVLFNQCSAIRTAAFKKVGGFNESYRCMEDYDLSLRLALQGAPWTFISEPQVVWRQGSPESLSLGASGIRVRENEIKIRGLAHESVSDTPANKALRKLLKVERERNQRELVIAKLYAGLGIGSRQLAWLLARTEHYRKALYRRRASFPRMQVRPLPKLTPSEVELPVATALRSK